MPSRAVLRKKARRESKRQKQLQNSETKKVGIDHSDASETTVVKSVTAAAATTSSLVWLQKQHVANTTSPSAPVANAVARVRKNDEFGESKQRKRKRENADLEDVADETEELPRRKLTHKERVKMAAQAKLEKEIMRLNAISARAEMQKRASKNDAAAALDSNANITVREVNMNNENNEINATHHLSSIEVDANDKMEITTTALERSSQVKNSASENSDACDHVQQYSSHSEHDGKEENANSNSISHVMSVESKPRHDPRFVNGTFWRNRKEKRARTLFVGGMPSTYSIQEIEELIDRAVRKDSNAAPYLQELSESDKVVEYVDLLPLKHGSKVRHMFVVMASVALAGCASLRLDGMRINQHALRCNFAADKTQRAEAIRRRAGPQKQEPRR